MQWIIKMVFIINRTASSEFGTYRIWEQGRFRRACAFAQSRQNLRCSLIQAMSQEEPSDRKPDPWPLWMARHAQLKFVMTECSKTQIHLTGLNMCFGWGFSMKSYWQWSNWWTICNIWHKMSLVTRKPVSGVCDQGRLKPACAATEARQRLEISDIETRDIILSRQRTTQVLIRLCRCAGWSAPLLFAYGINRFSHDVAQITLTLLYRDRTPLSDMDQEQHVSPIYQHHWTENSVCVQISHQGCSQNHWKRTVRCRFKFW